MVSLASVDGDEELEILPNPEPLASPERSAIDEQKFNVGLVQSFNRGLVQQFSEGLLQ